MPTNDERILAYYSDFDEWRRLDSAEGRLEFDRAVGVLERHLSPPVRVLDLGGGAGRYTAALARCGHRVVLADVSPALLEQAKRKLSELDLHANVESLDQIDARDLGRYEAASFDAVVAFGPFYHLLDLAERERAAREIGRVLKTGGLAFIAFIPRISGVVGLIQRAAGAPDQVSPEILRQAATPGVFRNGSDRGFQEGYYATPDEIQALFGAVGFRRLETLSLRSIVDGIAEQVHGLQSDLSAEVVRLSDEWSREPSVIATSGHAVHVARKVGTEPT